MGLCTLKGPKTYTKGEWSVVVSQYEQLILSLTNSRRCLPRIWVCPSEKVLLSLWWLKVHYLVIRCQSGPRVKFAYRIQFESDYNCACRLVKS